jgi:hypothetical protein
MKKTIALIFSLMLIATAAQAQTPPYTYPQTIGTASVTILAANPSRKKLIFHNPNDQAKIAVCPVGPNRTAQSSQALIVAVINGPGCITILPYDRLNLDNGAAASNPPLSNGSAWVGIASAPGSALTIWEWE